MGLSALFIAQAAPANVAALIDNRELNSKLDDLPLQIDDLRPAVNLSPGVLQALLQLGDGALELDDIGPVVGVSTKSHNLRSHRIDFSHTNGLLLLEDRRGLLEVIDSPCVLFGAPPELSPVHFGVIDAIVVTQRSTR